MSRLKRFFPLLLLCAMLLAAVPAQAAEVSYKDVPKKHWAYESICAATERGLMQGVGANKFGLKQEMSRAAYATALCRLMKWDMITPETGSFEDNQNPAKWYYSAIETACANGALPKQGPLCRPNDAITREEMAVMTVRALGYANLAGLVQENCPFTDLSTSKGYITLAYQLGLVNGTASCTFSPLKSLSREEAATVLLRVQDRQKLKAKVLSDTAPADAVRADCITDTDGAVPMSPRAPLEAVYAAAVKAKGGAVVLHATPLHQTVQDSAVIESSEIPKPEVVELIKSGAEVHRSLRYESSYLFYKEGKTTHIVWYESDADLAQKTAFCAMLGVKTVYIER